MTCLTIGSSDDDALGLSIPVPFGVWNDKSPMRTNNVMLAATHLAAAPVLAETNREVCRRIPIAIKILYVLMLMARCPPLSMCRHIGRSAAGSGTKKRSMSRKQI